MDQTCLRRTSKLLIALLVSGLLTSTVFAQAPKPAAAGATPAQEKPADTKAATPDSPEKVVLKVGSQQFTKADIDFLVENLAPQAQQALATQGRKPLGDQYATIVMLAQQARTLHLDQSPAFKRQLALQEQQLEAKAAYEEINKQVQVTPADVQQYYTAHTSEYDQIMLRQIVVRKRATDTPAAAGKPPASTGPGLPPEEAKTRAEAIRKELAAGTDVKKVIENFKSPGDIIIDAEPHTVRRGSMRPEMEELAFALKPGEVSKTFDVPQAVVLFQVTEHGRVELKDVTPEIERSLRQQKVEAAMAEVKKKTTLWMDDQYFAPAPKPAGVPTLGAPVSKIPPKH
jgi:parvulin-like peptidyl-prolyl isomerase